jgi:two-component system response regulator ResD
LSIGTTPENIWIFPGLTINHDSYKVLIGEKEVPLTRKEYELLFYMAKSQGTVFTREDILLNVWEYGSSGYVRTVDTYIKRLRNKLYKVSSHVASYIITVWGVGYKFDIPSSTSLAEVL